MKLIFDSSQLVLFSPGIIIPDKLKFANAIRDKYLPELNGDPVIIPIPDDAPDEIMRIQMNSKDKRFTLLIAKSRIDFFFKYKEDSADQIFPPPGLYEKFTSFFQYLSEELHIPITRAANVTRAYLDINNKANAPEILSKKYLKDGIPIKNSVELEIHSLNRRQLAGFEINKWTRIFSSHLAGKPNNKSVISFLIDINTLAEITYSFEKASLLKFLEDSAENIKLTLKEHTELLTEK